MAKIYASKEPSISQREIRNQNRARAIAAQGMVLLENDGILPIKADGRKLAVFGSGVRHTVKGGTGSGDVNSRSVVNVEQGLEDAGFQVATKAWLDRHDSACNEAIGAYMAHFQQLIAEKGMAGILYALSNPYRDPDVPEILPEDMAGTEKDLALYVIARTSGEGSDRKAIPGDYELSDMERRNLETLTANYDKTVVVLNVGGVIDTKLLRALKGIGAILLMGQPGNISGLALADVVTGRVTPSGHLTATWAENYLDYPSADSFSHRNGNLADEYYSEGIYVGYRWFDSFGKTPAYPFGYGKSYTTFSIRPEGVSIRGGEILVSAAVQNTGAIFSGKETVQVYVSQPQGGLDKPYQILAGFAKTKELAPGEKQSLTVSFPVESLTSYDEEKAAWVLEEGRYAVRVGAHSRNTHVVAVLKLDETVFVEQLANKLQPDCCFTQIKADPANFYSYSEEAEELKNALVLDLIPASLPRRKATYSAAPAVITTDKQSVVTMADVLSGKATLDDLAAQLSVPELAELCVGTARGGFGSTSTIGAASAA